MKLLAVALALAFAAPAHAATWRQVAPAGGRVGYVRTHDGVLHVAWHNGEDLFHTSIRPGGKVGATTPIATLQSVQDPRIVAAGGGLRMFWGELNSAFSPDGGTSWQLPAASIVAQAYPGSLSATALPNGSTLQAWAGTSGIAVHAGLDPNAPSVSYGAGFLPALATDASGHTMLAWFSNGVVAQGVNADGTPSGAPMTMPGGPPAIVARANDFFVASAAGDVRVWQVGTDSTLSLGAGDVVSLAADAKGRVWAVWADDARVYAARSDRDVSEFGTPVTVGRRGTLRTLDASATGSALDVLAQFENATYVKRVRPGLTLVSRRRGNQVTFSVSDADQPLKGVRLKVAGRKEKTDRNGRVTITVRKKATAVATRSGYTPAKLKVSGVPR